MKRLMMLSITILCLSVSALIGFHLGVQKAEADWDPSVSGMIVGLAGNVAFSNLGEAWVARASGWERITGMDLPVEVSEVKLYGNGSFVTKQDEGYRFDGSWRAIGSLPPSVDVRPSTWGQLKNQYQEDK